MTFMSRMGEGVLFDADSSVFKSLQDSMFAVSPKSWCEHLAGHVKPLPPGGIDSTLPCEICGASPEVWVCLSCYHVSEITGGWGVVY